MRFSSYHALWSAAALIWVLGSLAAARRDGLPALRTAAVLLCALPICVLGARLHVVLLEERTPLAALSPLALLLTPGYRLPGGLVLVLCCGPALAAIAGVRFRALADCVAAPTAFALATGRLGCFVQGCCFGRPSDLPWALALPRGSEGYYNHVARRLVADGAPSSLPMHPLPLYLVLFALGTAAALVWLRRRRRWEGEAGLALVALLGTGLGSLEWLREVELVSRVPLRQAMPLTVGLVAWAALVALRRRHGAEVARAVAVTDAAPLGWARR